MPYFVLGTEETLLLLVNKEDAIGSTGLFFTNEGDVVLSWLLAVSENDDRVPLALSSLNGMVSAGELEHVTLSFNASTLQARAPKYTIRLMLNTSSPTPTPHPIVDSSTIVVHAIVSAMPNVLRSIVRIENSTSLTASDVVRFGVIPVDDTGLEILDASHAAFSASLVMPKPLGSATTCSVIYDASSDGHRGECALPSLVADEFEIEVRDASGALVGGTSYSFHVRRCPQTYVLNPNDALCECAAGSYDTGLACAECTVGSITPDPGAKACSACPAREEADPSRTHCECEVDYYRDDTSGECSLCPGQVTCAWNSTIRDWELKPGAWRSDDLSSDLRSCRFGVNGCPGTKTSEDDANCTARGFGDWPHCACGYVGPECAVCDAEYFPSWEGDKCERCGPIEGHVPSIVFGSVVVFLTVAVVAAIVRSARAKQLSIAAQFKALRRLGKTKTTILFFVCQARTTVAAFRYFRERDE